MININHSSRPGTKIEMMPYIGVKLASVSHSTWYGFNLAEIMFTRTDIHPMMLKHPLPLKAILKEKYESTITKNI